MTESLFREYLDDCDVGEWYPTMMDDKRLRRGIVFALAAAFVNSTSGIFAKLLILDFAPGDIAFSKCLLGFLVLTGWVAITRRARKQSIRWTARSIAECALCALFGFFGLFAFETLAYRGLAAPLVVVSLIGASTITTLVAAHFFLHERMTRNTFMTLIMIAGGLSLMLPSGVDADPMYLLLAIASGACYGAFLLLAKHFKIPDGLEGTWVLIGFGATFLAPFTSDPLSLILEPSAWPYLLPLALVPTILGYLFTVKALGHAPASTVQLFEVSEPVFSGLLAFALLGEIVSQKEGIGAAFVICSLLMFHFKAFDRVILRLRSGTTVASRAP